MNFNQENIIKYFIMFSVLATSTFIIPTCGVLQKHAIYVGLIASTTFALIDMCYPNHILIDKDNKPLSY